MIWRRQLGLLDEYYNAGRDLASVYDQMLGLILRCTAGQDQQDPTFPRLFLRRTASRRCRRCVTGLASSTLIAWSRIISDSLDHMRTAANRRVEAELCAVRLCSLGADNYDTLGGRVEALEEKLKNGVPVQMVPQQPRSRQAMCRLRRVTMMHRRFRAMRMRLTGRERKTGQTRLSRK